MGKLERLFILVHGEVTGSCYLEIGEDEQGNENEIRVMKDGNLCWTATKVDLMFDYLELPEEN